MNILKSARFLQNMLPRKNKVAARIPHVAIYQYSDGMDESAVHKHKALTVWKFYLSISHGWTNFSKHLNHFIVNWLALFCAIPIQVQHFVNFSSGSSWAKIAAQVWSDTLIWSRISVFWSKKICHSSFCMDCVEIQLNALFHPLLPQYVRITDLPLTEFSGKIHF